MVEALNISEKLSSDTLAHGPKIYEKDLETKGVITIEAVSKVFSHPDGSLVQALKEVELNIESGEFITLIGPSGCGKSTLLRLIAGLETATSGSLCLDGKPIVGPDAERGLVFQNPYLFPWLNIHNNVAFGLKARRVFGKEKDEVSKYLELVGLLKFGKVYPHHLSGGMAQRASLARALINKPTVLLLDEPLGALDAFTRMNMQDEILRIRSEKHITMVMVTHDVDEAIYLSHRIVVMTPTPGKVERILKVPFPRPRSRNTPDFLLLRGKILEILHFAGHLEEPPYQI
ncbi:MAG: ABC transporter ATP-binding protein [Deltaproteobacteria bacterium]|jgi:NitT/TauT family transport system ATP-binding protein/sulfonate transport system ATP-binding protein|nr:ABC transporter ATP-binding protein [Deltaproteobacteria bacterium]